MDSHFRTFLIFTCVNCVFPLCSNAITPGRNTAFVPATPQRWLCMPAASPKLRVIFNWLREEPGRATAA